MPPAAVDPHTATLADADMEDAAAAVLAEASLEAEVDQAQELSPAKRPRAVRQLTHTLSHHFSPPFTPAQTASGICGDDGSGRGGGAVVLAVAGGMCTSGVQVLRGGAGEAAEMRLYGGVRACGNSTSSQRAHVFAQ